MKVFRHPLFTIAMLAKTKKLASVEQADGKPLIQDPDFARKVAAMEIKIESLNATELRIFSALAAGQGVGPESSMLKCAGSEVQQAITELSLEAVGGYAAPFVQDMDRVDFYTPKGMGREGPIAERLAKWRAIRKSKD